MATECCMERPGGLLRSGRIPGLAALVGIALSKRKCLSGGGKPGQPFLFAPFTLQGLEVSSRTGPSRRRAGLRRTQVATTLVDDGPLISTTGAGDGSQASAGRPAAFPGQWLPDT